MSALDALAAAALATPPPSLAASFVAEIAGDPAALAALLTQKLLEAIVTATPQRGSVVAETPFGTVTLATPQPLPPAALLVLRPAAQPGRAVVTVRAAAPSTASASPPPVPPTDRTVAIDIDRIVGARLLAPATPPNAPPLRSGTIIEIELYAIVLPDETAGSGAAPATAQASRGLPQEAPAETTPTEMTASPGERAASSIAQPALAAAAAPGRATATTEAAPRAAAPSSPQAPPASTPTEAPEPATPPDRPVALPARPVPADTAAAPPGAAARHSGIVLASQAGETIADTDIGLIAIPAELGAPAGSTLVFAVPREATSANPPPAADAPPLPREIADRLGAALEAPQDSAPTATPSFAEALQPTAPARVVAALLTFAAAIRGDVPSPVAALAERARAAGDAEAARALGAAAEELHDFSTRSPSASLQPILVPMMEGGLVQPLTLFLPRDGGQGRPGDDPSARFALEIELSLFGPLQLDGLVRQRRFDLILRSRDALPPELRAELATAFGDSLEAAGFTGEIAFSAGARFPIAIARQRALSIVL
jgi:hypothetical protein